jgi:sensor histidine kinase YesM
VRKLKDDRRKLREKLHLHDLESQSLLGQLKPHFIFNILTPLQGFFMSGEKIKGLNYLDSFSRLMRGMLNAIRGRYAPLNTEMEFIKHYLNIQQERFDHCFSYHIDIDPLIDAGQCIIPTLMLQPLVENALEHGIERAGKNGMIKIIIENRTDAIAIKVEDNGKGLPQDFKMKDNHALTIITERVQLMKKITGIGHFSVYNNTDGKPGATALLILTKDKPI